MAIDFARLPVIENGVQADSVTEPGIAGRLMELEAADRGDHAAFDGLKVWEAIDLPLSTVQILSNLGSAPGFFHERRAVLVLDGREPAEKRVISILSAFP